LPLYYNIAPSELLVPHETLDKEFLSLAEAEGLADIEHLNKVLDRAVNLKNFLKGKKRIREVAQVVAKHYKENVEPLGYKAFLVGVDREACAHYKHALDVVENVQAFLTKMIRHPRTDKPISAARYLRSDHTIHPYQNRLLSPLKCNCSRLSPTRSSGAIPSTFTALPTFVT